MNAIYHFSGAGNDFVVIDGREGDVSAFREELLIQALCQAHKTDGLMILGSGNAEVDFVMEFYNPDGSGGMMCGNGGRCIVAFADYLGIRPGERFLHPSGARNDKETGARNDKETGVRNDSASQVYLFRAPDGLHTGEILDRPEDGLWEVRIKMIDVQGITPMLGGYFLNTGTRHFVKFVDDVEQVDIDTEGKALRWNEAFAPVGTNVNFVHIAPDGLHVRTFEKGVEGETLACGTGLTACAIAAYYRDSFVGQCPPRNDSGVIPSENSFVIPSAAKESVRLRARQDWLSVNFTPEGDEKFTDVYLTGPARLVEIL